MLVHLRIQRLHLLDQAAEVLEMPFAARNLFVHHEAIETFLWRLAKKLFGNRTVLLGCEAQTINQALHFDLSRFHALAQLNLLLACEQGALCPSGSYTSEQGRRGHRIGGLPPAPIARAWPFGSRRGPQSRCQGPGAWHRARPGHWATPRLAEAR